LQRLLILDYFTNKQQKMQTNSMSDHHLPAKLMATSADSGCCVVSTTDPYDRILGFLDRSSYFFFQEAPQLYSRGWEDPVPIPLLLRKSDSARESNPRPQDL
jgi:hypothetical protein